MVKYFISLLSVFLTSTITQKSNATVWKTDFNGDRAIVKNEGQYDNRNWRKASDPVLYGYSENPFYVFFSKQGVTYRIDKTWKDPKWNRQNGDDPTKKRNIQTAIVHADWVGANPNVEVISDEKTSYYYSFAIKNYVTGEITNPDRVPGFKKITY